MRVCGNCGAHDRPYFEQAPCSCGAAGAHDDAPRPEKHRPDCRCLGHEVVLFPVRIALAEITYDAAGKEKLKPGFERAGWQFKRDGAKMYRVKMLCRTCIGQERDRQERRREYEKLCKAVRGEDTQTYAQMLASQG